MGSIGKPETCSKSPSTQPDRKKIKMLSAVCIIF
jgi:hypothetical protein